MEAKFMEIKDKIQEQVSDLNRLIAEASFIGVEVNINVIEKGDFDPRNTITPTTLTHPLISAWLYLEIK